MPHRSATFRELCAVCKTQTDTACVRCAAPLCERHIRAEGMCRKCLNAFGLKNARYKAAVQDTVTLGVPSVVIGGITAWAAYSPLFGAIAAVGTMLTLGLTSKFLKYRHRRFVAQHSDEESNDS